MKLLASILSLLSAASVSAATLNVKNAPYSAHGDGTSDDTAHIQSAINAAGAGDMVYVPDGTYLINTLYASGKYGLVMRDNMTFLMASNAVLQGMTNTATVYALIVASYKTNLTIAGGTIVGEKSDREVSYDSEDYGMGIQIQGCYNVTVSNVVARDCWGDGFYLPYYPSTNITFVNCTADGNRRQGMSIEYVYNLLITNCTFSRTAGTPAGPCAGIDIEPYEAGQVVRDVLITHCLFTNNAGGGVLVAPQVVVMNSVLVSNVVVEYCTILTNGWDSYALDNMGAGIQISGCRGNIARNNYVDQTVGSGLFVHETSGTNWFLTNRVTRTKRGPWPVGNNYAGAGYSSYGDTNTVINYNTITNNSGPGITLPDAYGVNTNYNTTTGNEVGDAGIVDQSEPTPPAPPAPTRLSIGKARLGWSRFLQP
jgi:parallel beta-helix repeat protein